MRGKRFEISDSGPNKEPEDEIIPVMLPRKDIRILQDLIANATTAAPSTGHGDGGC